MEHECDGCGNAATRLSYSKPNWLCRDCYVPPKYTPDVHLGKKIGNKHAPHMTYGDAMHIKTRRAYPDGIVRSHPRWETKEW